MIYTLTLNPAVDYRLDLSALTAGETNRAETAAIRFGGKGINVSLVLHELGVDAVAWGFAAGFTGDALVAHLRALGVADDFVHLPEGVTRINVKLAVAGVETEINAPGPAIPPDRMDSLAQKLDTLTAGDTLVMAGRLPSGLPADTYARLMDGLTERGVRVIVDTSGEALRGVLPLCPFLIKPNLAELEEAVGRSLRRADGSPDIKAVAEAAAVLQAAGAQNILVTLGGYGAYLLDADGHSHTRPAPRGESRGTVGAGDSAVAGFLASLETSADYARALRYAVAAGSATALSDGLATRETIKRVLADMDQA